jgi:hypothetical protein
MTARDCATAAHLVRLLDSLSSPSPSPPPYLALLNYAAVRTRTLPLSSTPYSSCSSPQTARQARKVLDRLLLGLNDNDDDSQHRYSHPATLGPKDLDAGSLMLLLHHRTLLLDLDTRLSAAEQQLARLAPAQSGSSSSTLLSVCAHSLPRTEKAFTDSTCHGPATGRDDPSLPRLGPAPRVPRRPRRPRRPPIAAAASASASPSILSSPQVVVVVVVVVKYGPPHKG